MSTQQRERGRPRWRAGTAATAAILAALLGFGALPAYAVDTEPVPNDPPTTSETKTSETTAPPETQETKEPTPEESAPEPEAKSEGKTEQAPAPRAAGEPPTLALSMSIRSDGTPDWNGDDNAGNDSGPNNGIVRVNDTVTYRIDYGVSVNPGTNVSFDIVLPKGLELTQLPGYCLAGSSITPESQGTPTPVTANSINELQEQTLHCVLGNLDNRSDTVDLTVKALNYAHQGMDLQIVSGSITADEATAPVDMTTLPTVKASARLMWDISKNAMALAEDSGYMYGFTSQACPWDSTITCQFGQYPMTISAPAGGKGAMPAVGDFTITDDLSPEALFPGLTAEQYAQMHADPEKYGARMTACDAGSRGYSRPNPRIIPGSATNTAANSVRNTGTCSFTQSPGGTAVITLKNTDWSLRTFPSESGTGPGGPQAVPAGRAYAASAFLYVYVPTAAVKEFGTVNAAGTSWTLATQNRFTA
ncbi:MULTISPECIES: hypothetical protein [unclassified Microbacterium]|uniref:hypothetical protein n=1 Tax=unclassified Microbacterium TaxID=2609290 RepID=UPI003018E5EC